MIAGSPSRHFHTFTTDVEQHRGRSVPDVVQPDRGHARRDAMSSEHLGVALASRGPLRLLWHFGYSVRGFENGSEVISDSSNVSRNQRESMVNSRLGCDMTSIVRHRNSRCDQVVTRTGKLESVGRGVALLVDDYSGRARGCSHHDEVVVLNGLFRRSAQARQSCVPAG